MDYKYSKLDEKNKSFFKNNNACSTLHRIKLKGKLRGLINAEIDFDYPISVIAGKNGCGKTTLLSLAACAYHNEKKGYKVSSKKPNYYTFSDFFIQTNSEVKPDGIEVWYQFLHDNWKGVAPGLAYQAMKKKKKGKWSRYESRINKNVIYLGIDRVVPQSEKQVYKTYRKYFHDDAALSTWYNEVARHVGKILGKKYDSFKIQKANNYKLPLVTEKENVYSGFNMGAGEKALFELFSVIFECSLSERPILIIIDEIELGLHEEAQKNLIMTLKEICIPKKLQIICTTHSSVIMESIPPEGRFYVEKDETKTRILNKITSKYAAGRMAQKNSSELDIYVEDETSQIILESVLDLEQRSRLNIFPVGSHSSVCRQIASCYRLKNRYPAIAFIDGDKRGDITNLSDLIVRDLEISIPAEKTKCREWIKEALAFMPGTITPEKWLLEKALLAVNKTFAESLGVKLESLKVAINAALQEDAHSEFYELGRSLAIRDYEKLKQDFTRLILKEKPDSFDSLLQKIKSVLG